MDRRIVITGIGAVSPLGIGTEVLSEGLISGRSGVDKVSLFDVGEFPIRIAAEVPEFDPKMFIQQRKSLKVMARDIQLSVASAIMGMKDSGIELSKIDPTRLGVSLGAGFISMSVDELNSAVKSSLDDKGEFSIREWGSDGMNLLFPLWMLKYLPNMPACHISIMYNTQGPNNTVTSACAASTQAIGEGLKVIQRGDADMMIAGGTDSNVNPLNFLRYNFSKSASRNNELEPHKVSRPFDKARDGFVVGEGAGVVMLEELNHAKARGAKIYGELCGYGSASFASNVYGRNYNDRGLICSMEMAIADSNVNKEEIDYVNANGFSTPVADRVETAAIKKVLGERAYKIPVSAIKSMVGHLGAASGIIQLISTVQSFDKGVIPPTINYENRDPECDLDYVPNTAREYMPSTAIINSFGLGGQIGTLIVKKHE